MRSFVIRRRNALTALALAALCAAALVPSLVLSQGRQDCNDLLAYYREAARAPQIYYGEEAVEEEEAAVADETEEADFASDDSMMGDEFPASGGGDVVGAAGGPADLGARSETGTNVQVAGVDESDIVKTNGSEIFVLRDDALVVVSVQEDPPQVIGGLRFGSVRSAEGPRELLLAGERLLIFRSVLYGGSLWAQQGMQIVEVDVSAPARPRALRTLDVYGEFVTARLAGSGVRVVMSHDGADSPGLMPRPGETWEQRIERSALSTWLPLYALTDHASGGWRWGLLSPCGAIRTPEGDGRRFSGTETTLLLSFDSTHGIADWGAAGFVGSTDAVYAGPSALYVASSFGGWIPNTRIHRWDTPPGGAPVYQGAAEVEGWLINQFAMSEYGGRLRVATTIEGSWPISSRLTIFDIGEDGLTELSKLDGLGPSERIYAVRFLGELGYVVTFRLIDPLYVLDLSDPENPAVAGELKIPGFSSYLHPLGGGLLLGVGQNADPRTGQPLGLQVSLFDVSDPAEPTRLDQVDLSASSRNVAFEHRAFTYHQGRAYVPASPTNDLFAVRVTSEALELERQITAQDEVLRSLPIGDRLHLLLEGSLATHDLATLSLLSGVYLVPPSP